MHTLWTQDLNEENQFQVEKEDIRRLLQSWYIGYLWNTSEDELDKEILRLEGQLGNIREPKKEFWRKLEEQELVQKINSVELIETIRQKILELTIRKKNKFFGSYFYVTSRGAFYEKHWENTQWRQILMRIPELPYKKKIVSTQWNPSSDDSLLTRNIPREYFSGEKFSLSDE